MDGVSCLNVDLPVLPTCFLPLGDRHMVEFLENADIVTELGPGSFMVKRTCRADTGQAVDAVGTDVRTHLDTNSSNQMTRAIEKARTTGGPQTVWVTTRRGSRSYWNLVEMKRGGAVLIR